MITSFLHAGGGGGGYVKIVIVVNLHTDISLLPFNLRSDKLNVLESEGKGYLKSLYIKIKKFYRTIKKALLVTVGA